MYSIRRVAGSWFVLNFLAKPQSCAVVVLCHYITKFYDVVRSFGVCNDTQ